MKTQLSLVSGSFSYSDHMIFSKISFEVREGEIFCLLGPNGCGKTTLMRCLNGALHLKEGKVYLDNRDMKAFNIVEVAKKVGFVFQEQAVVFPYSVLEMVRMGRAPHLGFFSQPSQHDTEMAYRALEIVAATHLKDKPFTQISGGERQLVLIARALTQEPRVLLLDEPTSHLDFSNQVLILQTIQDLARDRGLSIVMTTHFPNHALLVSSHVALMKNGGFTAQDTPERVITEENLEALYGVKVKVVRLDHGGLNESRCVVPFLRAGA